MNPNFPDRLVDELVIIREVAKLAAALSEARRQRCSVAVAKLDRLSRDLHFISGLMADLVPELGAEPFVLHLFAAYQGRFGRSEGARCELGGPKLAEARKMVTASIKALADRHAANVLPIIREIQRAGVRSLHEIIDALNERGVTAPRGGGK